MNSVVRGIAALAALITLASCAAPTSAPTLTPSGSSNSVASSIPPPASLGSTTATCGSVSTHDFSVKTALYRADPGALQCLTQAVATCRPASLEIWQTGVDVGTDYLLTITGPGNIACTALLSYSGFGPGPTSANKVGLTDNCTAQTEPAAVQLNCPETTYRVPMTVVGPQPGLPVSPPGTAAPAPSSTFAQRQTKGPTTYPTGDNAEVLAVTSDSAGQPVLTLLMPRMYCPSVFYGISAVPAPGPGSCVVTFDDGTGDVGPAGGNLAEFNDACPAWPTPHVTFVIDSAPTTGCQPAVSPVTGMQPGAIGWLVEGGGFPYFVLADGTEIHPRTPNSPTPRAIPSPAPTP
jgi:hypothetical protein